CQSSRYPKNWFYFMNRGYQFQHEGQVLPLFQWAQLIFFHQIFLISVSHPYIIGFFIIQKCISYLNLAFWQTGLEETHLCFFPFVTKYEFCSLHSNKTSMDSIIRTGPAGYISLNNGISIPFLYDCQKGIITIF